MGTKSRAHTSPASRRRRCVTKDPANKISFTRPNNYDPREWELLRRYYNAPGGYSGLPSTNIQPVPGNKYDMNNGGGISTDLIGGSWGYPLAGYEERKQLFQRHKDYVQGLL